MTNKGIFKKQPTKDIDGFSLLISRIDSFDKDECIIGLESTAHCGDDLICFLVTRGSKVCLINHIQTFVIRKNNILKTKTDKVDTLVIGKTLIVQSNLRFVSFDDLNALELKQLGRFRNKSVKNKSRLKIQITAYLDQIFPELQYFFKSGLHQKSVYTVLKEAPSLLEIRSMHLTHLAHLLKVSSHGHFGKEVAQELRVLAQNSIGLPDSALSILVTQSINQIELLDSHINALEKQITNIMKYSDSVIMSIPGIGYINGGMILGE